MIRVAIPSVRAGDINGDGYEDLIIGAPHIMQDGSTGRSYVVFGRPRMWDSSGHGGIIEP